MKLQTWLGLVVCNIIWAVNPSVAKHLIHEMGAEHTALLKYIFGFLTYILFAFGTRALRISRHPLWIPTRPRGDFLQVVLIGFTTCFLSPLTQAIGIQASGAASNCILITFEPLIAVFLGWLLYDEKITRTHILSFSIAVLGFFILSQLISLSTKDSSQPTLGIGLGELILLVGVTGESLYTVLNRKLMENHPASSLFGTAMFFGVCFLSLMILPWKGLPPFERFSGLTWLLTLWFGGVGTAITYLYWLYALQESGSLSSVVLSLFLQPLVGTAVAILFMGETLGPHHILGGFLILFAVLLQMIAEYRGKLPQGGPHPT